MTTRVEDLVGTRGTAGPWAFAQIEKTTERLSLSVNLIYSYHFFSRITAVTQRVTRNITWLSIVGITPPRATRRMSARPVAVAAPDTRHII